MLVVNEPVVPLELLSLVFFDGDECMVKNLLQPMSAVNEVESLSV